MNPIYAIRLFLWLHPWWHAAIVLALPVVVASIFRMRELRHSAEANRLRGKNTEAVTKIGELQDERNELVRERNDLEREKNSLMEKIAEGMKRPLSLAERNALRLRKYLRKTATVSEGSGDWGGMDAEIVDVSEDNVATLFVPAGFSSSSAFAVYVQCDELQIIEVAVGGCAVQIKILKRYGDTLQLGELRKWDDRVTPSTKPLPKGFNVFDANYNQPGTSKARRVLIYAPREGNPKYTLVAIADGKETAVIYGDNVEISKRFALLQVEIHVEGLRYNGGSGNPQGLFLFVG